MVDEPADWPPHKEQWEQFLWEIGEYPKFHSHFGKPSETELRRVWSIMEAEFFARYKRFIRVWPEWGSTGIWLVPYPGLQRSSIGNHLTLRSYG